MKRRAIFLTASETQSGYDRQKWAEGLISQPAEQQPEPDVSGLVEALDAAARSLETIGRQAGIDEYMCEFGEVRGYAKNRAAVAREALAAHRNPSGQADGGSEQESRGGSMTDDQKAIDAARGAGGGG